MARTKTKPVGRTPAKRHACEAWLAKQLADRPWPAQNILEVGVRLGWGWATVRRAKVNVGAQSFKKGHEWWWFDPVTYTPSLAPATTVAKKSAAPIPDPVMKRPDAVEQPNLPQALAAADGRQEDSPSSHRATPDIYRPEKSIENRSKLSAQSVPPQTREQEIPNKSIENRSPGIAPPVPVQTREQIVPKPIEPPKPVELPKPRRVRIWDSEITETRDALISTAGFADLYTMRADIRLRQEQLRAKGLLKEELALNDLVSRVNDALEKKKRAENLE